MLRFALILTAGLLLTGCRGPGTFSGSVPDAVDLSPAGNESSIGTTDGVDNGPGLTSHRLAEASRHLRDGRVADAHQQLVSLLRDDPAHVAGVEMLAEVSRQLGDERLQRAALIRLIRLRPRVAAIVNRAGKQLLYLSKRRSVERLASERDASERDAGIGSVTNSAGVERGKQQERPENAVAANGDRARQSDQDLALAALERAVELEPRRTQFVQDLFGALIESGKENEAEDFLRRALERNPRDPVLPMIAARFYESHGDRESATFYYGLAVRNDPKNRVWRRQRGMCHFRAGDFQHARDDLAAALSGTPVKPQLSEHFAWAKAALHLEKTGEAHEVLNRIVDEGELRTAEIELLRGQCRLQMGDIREAEKIVLEAQIDWPEHAGLRQLAREIELAVVDPESVRSPQRDLARLSGPGYSE